MDKTIKQYAWQKVFCTRKWERNRADGLHQTITLSAQQGLLCTSSLNRAHLKKQLLESCKITMAGRQSLTASPRILPHWPKPAIPMPQANPLCNIDAVMMGQGQLPLTKQSAQSSSHIASLSKPHCCIQLLQQLQLLQILWSQLEAATCLPQTGSTLQLPVAREA